MLSVVQIISIISQILFVLEVCKFKPFNNINWMVIGLFGHIVYYIYETICYMHHHERYGISLNVVRQ